VRAAGHGVRNAVLDGNAVIGRNAVPGAVSRPGSDGCETIGPIVAVVPVGHPAPRRAVALAGVVHRDAKDPAAGGAGPFRTGWRAGRGHGRTARRRVSARAWCERIRQLGPSIGQTIPLCRSRSNIAAAIIGSTSRSAQDAIPTCDVIATLLLR